MLDARLGGGQIFAAAGPLLRVAGAGMNRGPRLAAPLHHFHGTTLHPAKVHNYTASSFEVDHIS